MSRQTEHVRITSILLEAGVVTRDQIERAALHQRTTGRRIGETLVELGAATEEDIGWALARQLELPFVDPRPDALDRALLASFPEGLLQRLDAVPLVNEPAALSVAVADPLDPDLVRELETASGRSLSLSVATPTAIRSVLREVLGPSLGPGGPTVLADGARDPSGRDVVIRHVGDAWRAGATEVHLLPRPGSVEIFHRKGTRLASAGSEPAEALEALRKGLEQLGFRPHDPGSTHSSGHVVCPMGPDAIDVAVSVLRRAEGSTVVLDLSGAPSRPPALEDLGIDAVDLATLRGALDAGAGLAIVTGPPRSGGSTTLRALLAEATRPERRALALGPDAGPSEWAEIAVAQGADVLALDDLAMGDGVRSVLCPAAAGRLLLARTDWTDTFALLERLSSGPAERAALADRLLFVIQQRLHRRERIAEKPGGPWPRADRLGVFEVLVAGDTLRSAIREGRPAPLLRACAEEDGFRRAIDAA